MYKNRNYLIIPVSEISKVDFSLICETSEQTLRKSVDGTKTLIKWDQNPHDLEPEPLPFVNNIVDAEGPYTNEEIIEILNTSEWSVPMENI